jgi:tripartite ATP-independent transporter DctP family solute receptor
MKRMVNLSVRRLTFVLLLATLIPSNAPAADKKVIIKVGDPVAATDVINVSLDAWGKAVAKASNGSIDVRLFPNSQLGGELEMIQQVSAGTLDIVVTGNTGYDPLMCLGAPYANTSAKHAQKVHDSDLLDPYFEGFRKVQGIRYIAYLERNPRNLTANRAIMSPADMKGLKLRAPQLEVVVNAWKAVGANVTPLAFPELFQALQAGTVDAQENPVELIYNSKFYEVQKYLMNTEHGFSVFMLFINDKLWTGLTDDQRKAMQETLKEATIQHRARLNKAAGELTAKLKERGMQIIQPDKKSFRDIIWPQVSRPYMVKFWGEEQLKKFEALAD